MADNTGPNIYRFVRADGTFITGSSYMLAKAVPYNPRYIRELAKQGRMTRKGERVELVRAGGEFPAPPRDNMEKPIYVAENPNDDPIIGPADEIAALTGYTARYILNLASNGTATKAGWSVRRATEKEAKEADW